MTILLFAMTTSSVTAQNATTNATNSVGNASASVNQTASELGQNMSNAVGNAGQAANPCQNLARMLKRNEQDRRGGKCNCK
jgi:hypothetical protein